MVDRCFLRWLVVAALVFVVTGSGRAEVPAVVICRDPGGFDYVCVQNTPWFDLDRHTLSVRESGGPEQARWMLESTAERDFTIKYMLPGEPPGSIMVISGFAMLLRNMEISPLEQIRALEGPVLMSNLGLSLLYLSVPAGPLALVEGEQWVLMADDKTRPIRVSSPSAAAFFGAPWQASGEARRRGGAIDYEITLTFMDADASGGVRAGADRRSMVLSGTWQKLEQPLHYADNLSIEGWRITTLGPEQVEQDDGTVIDFAALFREANPRTVGDLRRLLTANR